MTPRGIPPEFEGFTVEEVAGTLREFQKAVEFLGIVDPEFPAAAVDTDISPDAAEALVALLNRLAAEDRVGE